MTQRWYARGARIILLVVAMGLSGCPTRHVVELDPLELTTVQVDGTTKVAIKEEKPLFKQATTLYDQGKYEEAKAIYLLFLESFPGSEYLDLVYFNLGLTQKKLDDLPGALASFEAALPLAEARSPKDLLDVQFQIAMVLQDQQKWKEAADAYEGLIVSPAIVVTDLIEAHTRRGVCLQELGIYATAEKEYKAALEIYQASIDVPILRGNYYVSMAQFQIGEIYRELFDSITFKLPLDTMKKALVDKSTLFLKAQSSYLKTVRLESAYWASAASFKIGNLYEAFFTDMLEAEVPPELTEEQVEVYRDELKKHIKPLIKRAIAVYAKTLELISADAGDSEWAKKTETALQKLIDLAKKEKLLTDKELPSL